MERLKHNHKNKESGLKLLKIHTYLFCKNNVKVTSFNVREKTLSERSKTCLSMPDLSHLFGFKLYTLGRYQD